MPLPATYRGTSVQVCGFYPFASGSYRPAIGVPIGSDIQAGTSVCCDAFSWFQNGFVSSPSMFILGLQGLGKSSFCCRQILGLADRGIVALITDLKSEYTALVRAMRRERPDGSVVPGQVMAFGQGFVLNLLDPGAMGDAARRIGGQAGAELMHFALARAVDAVVTQLQIIRRAPVADWETSLVAAAVEHLYQIHHEGRPPVLSDLTSLLHQPTEAMIEATVATSDEEYLRLSAPLRRTMTAFLRTLGRMYDGQSTDRIRLDAPAVSIDISRVAKQSEAVLASAMLASWSETFATIEAANALADAGIEPQRHFVTVWDEMWKGMRLAGAGLVDKADSITRLNRNDGVGNIFITHSLRDMESMESEADNMKARGFVERSGVVVTAGLAKEDLRALSQIKHLSEVEIDTVAGWATPPGWRPRTIRDADGRTRPAPPPGAGKVLIKAGDRVGIQTQVRLTPAELSLHDTNGRWLGAVDTFADTSAGDTALILRPPGDVSDPAAAGAAEVNPSLSYGRAS